MEVLKRAIVPVIILALVVAAALVIFGESAGRKTVVANFPRAVSIYEGSDVRVLGVAVGTVDEVEPIGDQVKVTMTYDADVKIPADASAVIVAPAVVGDRFVQLTPAFASGDTEMKDNTQLTQERTETPLELDEIFGSLDRLTVALGPTGANRKGALTDLLETTAANFGGQGTTFKQTIRDFSTLSATLEDNKEELFGSAEALGRFISTLAENDSTVRQFNQSLSDVSDLLAGERQNLTAALRNLGVALGEVGSFVKQNRGALGRNIRGLNRLAKVIVRQRDNFDEVLRLAPVGLSNLALTYNPDTGTLDTAANINNIEGEVVNDPAGVLCGLLSSNDPTGQLCNLIRQGLGRSAPFGKNAKGVVPPVFDPSLNGLVAP